MIEYKEIVDTDIPALAEVYVETFNAPPWNDAWTLHTASKRLSQMIHVEDFYGLCAYKEGVLCGLIIGCEEQFYNGSMFNIREFCVRNSLRGQGIGTQIINEFEHRLKQKGIKDIILFTSREDGTEGFYHKRGLKSYNGMVVMGKEI